MNRILTTSHGDVALTETSGRGPAVLLLHGNSSCKEVFAKQLESELGTAYRMIAFDLPGHGESQDAEDPERTYSVPGYAEVAAEVLRSCAALDAMVVGWSLGGHVGLQMLNHDLPIRGLMIAGSPPASKDIAEFGEAFVDGPLLRLADRIAWSEADVEEWVRTVYGDDSGKVDFLRHAARRTDGRARSQVFLAYFSGIGDDQRQLAENSPVPLAVINGRDDPVIDCRFYGRINCPRLWRGRVELLDGVGHMPFWQDADRLNQLLGQFLQDVS